MVQQEPLLLQNVLYYEQGHSRRTQHILKVYALAKLLGEHEGLSPDERQVLQAAAILHDIAIRRCKERYAGDACQENQKKEAPALVRLFLQEAAYPTEQIPLVIELVVKHHNYQHPRSHLLQLLIEADIIINCYENPPANESTPQIQAIFQTSLGKKLLELCIHGIHTKESSQNKGVRK